MKRFFSVLLVCCLLVCGLQFEASAYVMKSSDWFGYFNITYGYDASITSFPEYAGYMYTWDDALNSWINDQRFGSGHGHNRVYILNLSYASSDASITMGVTYVADETSHGVTYYTRHSGDHDRVLVSADTYINVNNQGENSYSAQSAAAHELGHIFGLEHEFGYPDVLMNTRRDRDEIYEPQDDDFDGVVAFYGRWNFETWIPIENMSNHEN